MRTTARNLPHSNQPRVTLGTQPSAIALAVAAAFLPWSLAHAQLTPPAPNALPTGGTVVHGNVNILPATPQNYLEVQQASQRGIVHWNSYDIGKSAHVHYQNNYAGSAAILNKIQGSSASQIYGKLTSSKKIGRASCRERV